MPSRLRRFASCIVLIIGCAASALYAADRNNVRAGYLDFNAYPYLSDVSGDSTFTLNAAASLPNRLSYFSLTNFYNQANRSELGDTNAFYTEQNLRWQIGADSAFDATAQYVMRSADNNDRFRLGARWRLHDSDMLRALFERAHLKWSINWHAIQFDHDPKQAWQIEHVFALTLPYISDRLYLSGFIDHNFNETVAVGAPRNYVVLEAQFGCRLIDNLYAVVEYRINQARRSDVNNVAAGLEYVMKW